MVSYMIRLSILSGVILCDSNSPRTMRPLCGSLVVASYSKMYFKFSSNLVQK